MYRSVTESVDVFGSQRERPGSIIMTAVRALALLISKVLEKVGELSAGICEADKEQAFRNKDVPKSPI